MDYKIFSYLDKLVDAYKEPVSVVDGLTFDHKDTLRTIEFYSNSQFISGNKDALGREKPFYNVCNYRVTVAKTATDLDVKDIKFEADSLNDSTATMLLNHELYKYLKDSNFSKTLNEMGATRPKYGGLLVKRDTNDGLDIGVVDWRNVDCDPVEVLGAPLIETHYMEPSDVADKSDVWEEVDEFLKAHSKANKGKPAKMEIKEVTGIMPVVMNPDEDDNEKNWYTYKPLCFYIGVVNKKKFFLYKEEIKDIQDKYRYLPWERVPGRGLGRGIIEDGFESQVWVNDAMISAKNAVDLTSKVILTTNSQKISGNAITGVQNGHIFQIEREASIIPVNLGPSKLPEIEKIVELWNVQYDKTSSTYAANTGEAPTAGTPYSQTALLNQVANSPFEYQREVWGIFLNEILNDWILPYLKKQIRKEHYLVSEFSQEELEMIDRDIKTKESNTMIKEQMMAALEDLAEVPTEMDRMDMNTSLDEGMKAFKGKREIEIPEGYLDIDGKITANITGELKNKQALLQSMAQIGKDIMATYNPNTNSYAAMENPFLRELYGSIIEMSGVNIASSKLKPTAQPDLSAIQPQNVAPAAV